MYIVIAGAGRLGRLLAEKLREGGHQVCIVERSPSLCEELAEKLKKVFIVEGDATNPEVLKEAKVEKSDVLAATTSSDEDNIIICKLAKELFRVKRTVSRVNDPKHLPLYKYMDVDVPVDSTSIVARIIEEEASFSDVMNLLSIKKGRLSIVRVDIPKDAPLINKRLRDIKLPPNSVLISIIRGTEIIIPSGSTKILANDDVLAVTLIDNERELIKALIGEV